MVLEVSMAVPTNDQHRDARRNPLRPQDFDRPGYAGVPKDVAWAALRHPLTPSARHVLGALMIGWFGWSGSKGELPVQLTYAHLMEATRLSRQAIVRATRELAAENIITL